MDDPTAMPICSTGSTSRASSICDDSSERSMSDIEDDTGFTEVTSKKTKKRRLGSQASGSSSGTIITTSAQQPTHGLTVIIKPADAGKIITKVNPLTLTESLDSIAPAGVVNIRPNHRLNVLGLDTRNVESTKALLKVTSLCGIKVTIYEPHPTTSTVGVIRGVSQEITDVQLHTETRVLAQSPVSITQVRRMGQSEVIKLVFASETIPEYATVGHMRFKIFPYVEKPRQCLKCRRFGHIASTCSKPLSCSRCGGDHDLLTCEADAPTCVNCKGQHDSTSRHCPVYRKEKVISNYRSANKVDYLSAKEAVKSPNKRYETEQRQSANKTTIAQEATEKNVPSITSNADFPPLPKWPSKTRDAQTNKNESTVVPRPYRKGHTEEHETSPTTSHINRKVLTASHSSPPRTQNLGSAVYTIATLVRNLLVSIESPLCQAVIAIIDIALPLVTSWCK
ncbi:hypothetical protein ISCGN_001776 [Ixodes scapularis]